MNTINYVEKWNKNKTKYAEVLYYAAESQGKNIYNFVTEKLSGFSYEPVHLKLFLAGIWKYSSTKQREQYREYARVIVTLCDSLIESGVK